MTLQNLINVKSHYTRSVNLERDAHSDAVISSYIPTSRALRTLDRVIDTFHTESAPRAWSLVGPYGSGKSSFSLFLTQLLGAATDSKTKLARNVLRRSDKAITLRLNKVKNGYIRVLVTGSPEPLTKRLVLAIHESVAAFFLNRRGKNPGVVQELADLAREEEITISSFLAIIDKLVLTLERAGADGIIIVIDELGKFLEYEARHYGANDIFLLQALAERACAGGKVNILLFVMLHQSFEQYAKGLGESLKIEWAKIQGRFEEVPFLETAEQTLRVVSAAFSNSLGPEQKTKISNEIELVVTSFSSLEILPGVLDKIAAQELFESCYPLHPLSAMILPSLCQKIAQNERTLFSYLGSNEDYGFLNMLSKLVPGQFIMPCHVFDYFVTNQTSFVGDYTIHRRWVEVLTALERINDADDIELALVKTIGLLNMIGSRGNLKPSKEVLSLVTPSVKKSTVALKSLQEKSVVNFRKFSGEYRIWQGSDFDLEAALEEELVNLGQFALAEELNRSQQLTPVVARKYSIESGALRYFVPIFVDAKSYLKIVPKADEPRLIFFLAFGVDDNELFEKLCGYFSDLDLLVLCSTSEKLREAVGESIALRKISASSQSLNQDPIARREIEDRLFTAELTERSLVTNFLEAPERHRWQHGKKRLKIKDRRSLQSTLSSVLGDVYCKAPIIHNEMINRDRPSTQANTARNRLLLAMQESRALPDLGIDKFPAEKAVYRAVLKETGIHHYPKDITEDCSFRRPDENATRIHFVWSEIEAFLASTEKQAKPFVELSAKLMAPPYGVKAGLLPILYFAAYQANEGELALYENRRYRPEFTADMIERFVKRPDEFAVQRFRIDGMRASIFKQYSKVIHGDKKTRTLLELAKPLASFMGSLPGYTQITRRGLSARAQKVRGAFNLAKSPEILLFEELPKSLGFGELDSANSSDLEDFSEKLIEVLRELRGAHLSMTATFKKRCARMFNMEPDISLSELQKVAKQLYGLDAYTFDSKGLGAFISRMTKVSSEPEPWFENVLMFLGRKPSKKWTDSDQDAAEFRLNEFAKQIVDLQRIRLTEHQHKAHNDDNVDFYLLRSIKKGGEFLDQVAVIDESVAKRIEGVQKAIENNLSVLKTKELKLAVIAKLVDDFLSDYKKESEQREQPDLKLLGRVRND